MGLTNFKGIQEMGIICGGGLLVCFVPMMTMLPVLLLRGARPDGRTEQGGHRGAAGADREISGCGGRLVRLASPWRCARLAAPSFRKVYFDYNLLHMQSAGLPAVG